MENFRSRRDGLLEPPVEIVRRRRDGELNAGHFDVFAPHALVPRRQHAGVVLLGREHFIPGLKVDPVLRDLQRLAGAARQGHLLRVTSELRGHAQADRLDAIGNGTLIKNGRHVDHVHVAPFRFQRHPRRRAGKAVIQVDDRAVQLETPSGSPASRTRLSRPPQAACLRPTGKLPGRVREPNPLAADATVPAAPAARKNDRRLHFVDLIKNLLNLSGIHFDDHIIRKRKKKASDRFLWLSRSFSAGRQARH